jgi:transposase
MGAPTKRLNDINESSIVLAHANRTLGHAPVSYRAQGTVPSPRASKITLILAISPFPGVVSDLIIEENTNINDLEQFIQKYLMSNIERGYFLMMDNLSSHREQRMNTALPNGGHLRLLRPPYSPDYAPVENAFSKVKAFLRAHRYELINGTLLDYVIKAIETTTVEDCAG